jgi:hypothetical protein
MHVMGQYTEWTEAPEVTTDYPGISLSAVVTSTVSMVITITAAEDVRGGEANLVMGDLQLPKTVEVVPAAAFVLDEGQTNPIRPGQNFSGKIVFAEGFGVSGGTLVRFNADDGEPINIVLTEQMQIEGTVDMGASGITVSGFVSPSAANGVADWRVLTINETQTIPVHNALEIADAPAVDVALGGTAEASLESGFALYRLTNDQGEVITAGTIVRVEALNADFPLSMLVSIPGTDDDPVASWSNTDTALNATSPTIEFIAPRNGAYFLSVDHAENLAGAEFTFTVSSAAVDMELATGQAQTVTLERPGHSAWFARGITAGQALTWSVNPQDDSDAAPAIHLYRHYTNEDENNIFGERLYIGGREVLQGNDLNYLGGLDIAWPEAWGEATLIWRVLDASLGGGGGYGMTFTGNVE